MVRIIKKGTDTGETITSGEDKVSLDQLYAGFYIVEEVLIR